MKISMALCAVLISLISLPAAASVQAGKVTDIYVSSGKDEFAFLASGTRNSMIPTRENISYIRMY